MPSPISGEKKKIDPWSVKYKAVDFHLSFKVIATDKKGVQRDLGSYSGIAKPENILKLIELWLSWIQIDKRFK